MKKVLIIAGDASGDLHSSNLMRELWKIDEKIEFVGIGGDKMESLGFSSIVPISEVSVVGFWEVAKKANFFQFLLQKIGNLIKKGNIDLFIPVDFPGFNQRVAKFAKKFNVPVAWYIAPQLWAWGENRSKDFAKLIDLLLVVFPFEAEYFEKFGIKTKWVGHPLLDLEIFHQQIKNYEEREKRIIFLPGSRKQEINSHIKLVNSTIELLNRSLNDFQFEIVLPQHLKYEFSKKIATNSDTIIADESSHQLMSNSLAGLIKTGTSNLEAALLGMPFAMFYRTSLSTYFIGKKIINLPYLSLVNILSQKQVIPELIQKEANPDNLAKSIIQIVENRKLYDEMQSNFLFLRQQLGEVGASKNAANIIYSSFLK
ncbi:MAG: lipid-A-disaccharide synthase [Candidatus Kapabacteria bacterium]|nr:lipid-A-disaccharide synthase [Candidatus Kapabacteria bacterium]